MSSKPRKHADRTLSALRHRAETHMALRHVDTADMLLQEGHRVVQELQIHQLELEMQNEELRQTQRELEAISDRYAALYDFAPVGYLRLDPNGVILEANLTAAHMLGVARARLRRHRLTDFVMPDGQDTLYRHRQQVFDEEMPQACDLWMQRQDGTSFYAQLKSVTRRDEAASSISWYLAVIDMTAQQHAEQALRQSQSQLRRLARHQEEQQEHERARIAREIHDELAQTLTGLHMDIAWLTRQPRVEPHVHDRLRAMAVQLDDLDKAVHRIAMELRPRLLDDLGLLAAIEWQLQEVQQRTGLAYTLQMPREERPMDPRQATAMFRIFQEALTNVVRHAGASRVEVRVTEAPEGVCLEVVDNGKGITPTQPTHRQALGILGMHERAQLWGGAVIIAGEPGFGATVTVRMPYRAAEEPKAIS